MDTIDVLEVLKENDIQKIEGLLDEKGARESVSIFAEFLDKRAYFNIDKNGNIKRKNMNYALPVAAFAEKNEEIALEIINSADPAERIKLKKIERFSKETIENLMKNFMKIIANNSVNFAIRYAKEIFLRDKELFYKTLFHYTLLEEIDSQKSLMALSIKKLMGNKIDDNLIHLAMSYISKVKANFLEYENTLPSASFTKADLIKMAEESKNLLASKRGVNLLAYIGVLKEYEYENEGIFVNIALKRLEELKNTPGDLTHAEEIIYKGL